MIRVDVAVIITIIVMVESLIFGFLMGCKLRKKCKEEIKDYFKKEELQYLSIVKKEGESDESRRSSETGR